LSQTGEPVRSGVKVITTGGWFWAIPVDAPDPRLSYMLARYITSKENQIYECGRFGMIPVRKDIRNGMDTLFSQQWMRKVYGTSYEQLVFNKSTVVPRHPRFNEICAIYLDAWFDIVVNRNWAEIRGKKPDRVYIQKVLEIKYLPRARRIY
jgi:ABC-type glycerol-3-phosphate transport system substrate-binding protein